MQNVETGWDAADYSFNNLHIYGINEWSYLSAFQMCFRGTPRSLLQMFDSDFTD